MTRSLKGAMKVAGIAAAVLFAIILPVIAAMPAYSAMPAHTGVSYPNTFWARMDYSNTVTGKVIASSGASHGIAGAYVAIVNATDKDVEYANTTSDADGSYTFYNVNATFYQNPDRYDPKYMVYAYAPGLGEAYSQSFGIDVAAVGQPVTMWVVIPVNATPTPTIAPTLTPTPTVVPSPSATPVIAHSPPGGSFSLWSLAIYAVIVIIVVLIVAGAYLLIRRR